MEQLINDILVKTNSYIKIKKILAILILATYHLPLHQPWPKKSPEEAEGWSYEQFAHIIKSAKFVFIPKPKKQTVGITRAQYKKFIDKSSTHKELPTEAEIEKYKLSPGFPYYSKKFEKLSVGEKIENLQKKQKQISEYREKKSKLLPKAVARHKNASKQTKDYNDPFVEQTPVPDNYVNYNYNLTHAMKQADFLLFSYSQHKYFAEEINRLRNKRPISVNSSLIGLNPQLIKKYGVHLLISKGRLAHALILERENTPVILSGQCIITKNYLRYIHEVNHHASRNFMYKFCRNSIYVPKATNLCKNVIRNCIDCEKMRAKVRPNKMQALPDVRIDIDNVTKAEKQQGHVGIAVNKAWVLDFCGPFSTSAFPTTRPKTRSQTEQEKNLPNPRYETQVCIVVDLLTRYTQAFCVPDLTTQSFLNCLISATSLLGRPSKIYLDNQPSFVAGAKQSHEANKIMEEELDFQSIASELGHRNIDFSFGVPESAWYQSGAERAVQSFKVALKHCLKTRVLSFYELQTQLYNISSYLNARPLAIEKVEDQDTSQPASYFSLTPNHLHLGFSGAINNTFYESTATKPSIKDLWKERKQLARELRSVFINEYLTKLQERNRWKSDRERQIRVGDLLLMPFHQSKTDRDKMNNLTISHSVGLHFSAWPLVRVVKLIYSDRDPKVVKAVELQKCDGNYRESRVDANGKPHKTLVLKKPSRFVRDINGLKDLHFFNEETERIEKEAEAKQTRNLLKELPNVDAVYNTEHVQFCHLNSRSKQMRLAKQRLYLNA